MDLESVMDKFNSDLKKITAICSVTEEQAACYLCNFEDKYICYEHDGGCKGIEQCRSIREKRCDKNRVVRSRKV